MVPGIDLVEAAVRSLNDYAQRVLFTPFPHHPISPPITSAILRCILDMGKNMDRENGDREKRRQSKCGFRIADCGI